MSFEVGMIVEGKVTGITKFGAFIDLEGGKTGMVHISEVAATYVNDIREHLTEGQTVKVKIMSISDDGKIGLSIKKALPQQGRTSDRRDRGKQQRQQQRQQQSNTRLPENEAQQTKKSENSSFEDMLSRFKQASDEKLSDMKRTENRRTGYSRRNNFQK